MALARIAADNMQALSRNLYPGRGIVIGLTPDSRRFVQVYWIMGRSANSRNRIFVQDGDAVRTAPFDASKVQDPSLIIYNAVRARNHWHVVSNGDQTDSICEAMESGDGFEAGLFTRSFEPDAPNFTPRIGGLVDLDDPYHAYLLAIIKSASGDGKHCARQFFYYETAVPGVGHCVTTYKGDGTPLPAFEGEPYALPLQDDIDATAGAYWQALDEGNRVSLLVKTIDARNGSTELRIVNKHQ
jgi:IMP cyclohydrolase